MDDFVFNVERAKRGAQNFLNRVAQIEEENGIDKSNNESSARLMIAYIAIMSELDPMYKDLVDVAKKTIEEQGIDTSGLDF